MNEQFEEGDNNPQSSESNEKELFSKLRESSEELHRLMQESWENQDNTDLIERVDEMHRKYTEAWEAYKEAILKARAREQEE